MKAVELAYSIFTEAKSKGKKAWLSDRQEAYLYQLLYKDGNWDGISPIHSIGALLPDGSIKGLGELTYEQTFEQPGLKHIRIGTPPHYIRRNGFKTKQILVY